MAITRLNHAVLYVRDAERSAGFYSDVLGFRRLPAEFPGAVFSPSAIDVATFFELADMLALLRDG